MKILHKLILGFTFIIIGSMTLAVLSLRSADNVHNSYILIVEHIVPELTKLIEIKAGGNRLQAEAMSYALTHSNRADLTAKTKKEIEQEHKEFKNAKKRLDQAFTQLMGLEHEDEDEDHAEEKEKIFVEIQLEVELLYQACYALIEAAQKGMLENKLYLYKLKSEVEQREDRFMELIEEAIEEEIEEIEVLGEAARQTNRQAIRELVLISVVGLFLIVGFGLYLTQSIPRSIAELEEGAEKISEGDFDYRIASKSTDELGLLTRKFDEMAARLKASLEREKQAIRAATQLEGEKQRADSLEQTLKELTRVKVTLEQKMQEVEKMNRHMIDRELKMSELKDELKRLRENRK